MSKIIVCNKWDLPLIEDKDVWESNEPSQYFKYVKRPKAGRTALCKEWLISGIKTEVDFVSEYFGGVGIGSTIIQNTLHPKIHHIFDLSEACVRQLKFAFPKNQYIFQMDAKESIGSDSPDIAILDFPSYTINHYSRWEKQLDKLFYKNPMGVIWMETAPNYFHFHKELYGKILGEEITDISSYLHAESKFLYKKYGYSLAKAVRTGGCVYVAAIPRKVEEIEEHQISGNGLTFVDN